jgi:hypothetical protein
MKQFLKHIGWALALVLMLLPACTKYDMASDPLRERFGETSQDAGVAIGTLRSQDGVRFIRLDGVSCSQIMNAKEVQDIPDGTRVFLQYRYIVAPTVDVADFCADAILVEWASPLEVGPVSYDMSAKACDPVHIVSDWMTSLEDGFVTLHYQMFASGKVQHTFSLYPTVDPLVYRLVHDACGDKGGELTDGLVCFDVSGLLPETGDEPVELRLEYIDLQNTTKRLTVEYQSPK